MNRPLLFVLPVFALLAIACANPEAPAPEDTPPTDPTIDGSDPVDPVPIDCPGMDGRTGVLRPLTAPEPRTELASFPLSVPSLAVVNEEIWLFAQMFQDEERHCDVIGMAPISELPSDADYPLTPLVIHDLPELGYPNPNEPRPFPPADPDVLTLEGRDEVVMITTLRLAEAPQEPCIGLSVARDPADPAQGFDYLEEALWCEPGVQLMDASGWYDAASGRLHVAFSDFTAGPNTIVNWQAQFDLTGDPAAWRFVDSAQSPFRDFHLFGTFDANAPECPGPVLYGTSNEPGKTGTRSACFDPGTTTFTATDLLVPDVRDPAVVTDPTTNERWLAYSE